MMKSDKELTQKQWKVFWWTFGISELLMFLLGFSGNAKFSIYVVLTFISIIFGFIGVAIASGIYRGTQLRTILNHSYEQINTKKK